MLKRTNFGRYAYYGVAIICTLNVLDNVFGIIEFNLYLVLFIATLTMFFGSISIYDYYTKNKK